MNPNNSIMRLIVVATQENITSKAGTLIETAASLNFVSKKFLNANEFYKYCKASPIFFVRVATEQHIVTDKLFFQTVFIIDGQEFTGLQFRVLSH